MDVRMYFVTYFFLPFPFLLLLLLVFLKKRLVEGRGYVGLHNRKETKL